MPIVIVNAASGLKTLKVIVEKAKNSPDGLTYGSSAPRSSQHLAVEYIRHVTGAKLVHVPYRGSVPAMTDALSGQVAFSSVDLTSAYALIKDGKLNALAVMSPARIELAPQIPTLAEAGFPGFSTSPWLGLFAPAGTPTSVLQLLSAHMREIMRKSEVITLAHNLSLVPAYQDEQQFTAFLNNDSRQWKEIIARLGPLN